MLESKTEMVVETPGPLSAVQKIKTTGYNFEFRNDRAVLKQPDFVGEYEIYTHNMGF